MNQLEKARKGHFTDEMTAISKSEGVVAEILLKNIAKGTAVILCNNLKRAKKPCAVGKGLHTKVNVNLGTSTDKEDLSFELKKLSTAVSLKADTVMDLSVGANCSQMLSAILKECPVPVGTVPVYQAAVEAMARTGDNLKFDSSSVLSVLDSQARQGVDFFTVHSGVTRENVKILKNKSRQIPIVSRGGAILAAWMDRWGKENPFYEHFDEILDIAHKYDVTLSLGDGLRPGAIADSSDKAQISELHTLSKLLLRARKRDVQVIIEGPGHVPINKIKENILLEKKICKGAPFYVLGPLVCDVGAGYDHITGAIGGAIAAMYGADFLCYVTPAEHLSHPNEDDVREGLMASRIAAHSADIAKGIADATKNDTNISRARNERDWEKIFSNTLDPEHSKKVRNSVNLADNKTCSMCGNYCSIKLYQDCKSEEKR